MAFFPLFPLLLSSPPPLYRSVADPSPPLLTQAVRTFPLISVVLDPNPPLEFSFFPSKYVFCPPPFPVFNVSCTVCQLSPITPFVYMLFRVFFPSHLSMEPSLPDLKSPIHIAANFFLSVPSFLGQTVVAHRSGYGQILPFELDLFRHMSFSFPSILTHTRSIMSCKPLLHLWFFPPSRKFPSTPSPFSFRDALPSPTLSHILNLFFCFVGIFLCWAFFMPPAVSFKESPPLNLPHPTIMCSS